MRGRRAPWAFRQLTAAAASLALFLLLCHLFPPSPTLFTGFPTPTHSRARMGPLPPSPRVHERPRSSSFSFFFVLSHLGGAVRSHHRTHTAPHASTVERCTRVSFTCRFTAHSLSQACILFAFVFICWICACAPTTFSVVGCECPSVCMPTRIAVRVVAAAAAGPRGHTQPSTIIERGLEERRAVRAANWLISLSLHCREINVKRQSRRQGHSRLAVQCRDVSQVGGDDSGEAES